MNFTFAHIENVKQIKMISSITTYGIGLITYIVLGFYHLFGIECKMYDKKIEKAKSSAACKLMDKAKAIEATGIMDVKFQIHGTTIFMYGIAYIEN